MIKCLNSLISINSVLQDFVFLVFKNLRDKIIQKSLRIYLKKVLTTEDHESATNLTGNL